MMFLIEVLQSKTNDELALLRLHPVLRGAVYAALVVVLLALGGIDAEIPFIYFSFESIRFRREDSCGSLTAIVVAITIFVSAEVCARYALIPTGDYWEYWNTKAADKFLWYRKLASTNQTPDIVFAGDSTAARGFRAASRMRGIVRHRDRIQFWRGRQISPKPLSNQPYHYLIHPTLLPSFWSYPCRPLNLPVDRELNCLKPMSCRAFFAKRCKTNSSSVTMCIWRESGTQRISCEVGFRGRGSAIGLPMMVRWLCKDRKSPQPHAIR